MLKDVKRVADSAQRKRVKMCGNFHYGLPFPLKKLKNAAANRRTRILFLSNGMSKRQTNQSFYNIRKKFISWTIEWRFHSTDVVLLDHGMDENTSLCSVIENHLKPGPWHHQLKRFCEEPLQSLKFFIRKYPKGPRSPFIELDIEAPIREQLVNLVIIEYPVIHVFLPSHHYNFEVIKAPIHRERDLKKSDSHQDQSPKCILFKEEEIEEDNSMNTQVLALMKDCKADGLSRSLQKAKGAGEKLKDTSLFARGTPEKEINNDVSTDMHEDGQLFSSVQCNLTGVPESIGLEFDQELLDAYSDLISEANPDDFFDFEGLFMEDVELEKRDDQAELCGVSTLEELEDGEIPE